MSRVASRRSSGVRKTLADFPLGPYLDQSKLPITSLYFLLPLMVLYSLGTRWYVSNDIIAHSFVSRFFHLLGVYGRSVPALTLVGILLAWHLIRKDRWTVRPKTLAAMAVESALLTVPIVLMSLACQRYVPPHLFHVLSTGHSDWFGNIVLSIGAGVYEEMVFRLVAFFFIGLIVFDLFKLPKQWGMVVQILAPALLFSLYHYLGAEPFAWQTFAFRTLAGVYFGVLYLFRGFGVTAGCHAAYDVVIVTWMALAH